MPISDPLVLAADVSITPASDLPPALRKRLGAARGDAAITRLRGRAPAKLVDARSAVLLSEFREAKPIAQAVLACAARWCVDPATLLDEAFPLLRDCFNSRFLVSADSDEASPLLPTRDRGDAIGSFLVLRCLQVVDDTELYQARDTHGRPVAVKLARPGTTGAAFFRREAAALTHLDGHGTPQCLATGRHERRPWLAMTWCDGVTPDVACRECRDQGDRDRLLDLLRRITAAYAALHRRGVLHGDVHPRNLLVERNDGVRILDFGLARAIAPLRLAGRGTRGGVPRYFAPEQASADLAGKRFPFATARSEQFAVAVMLYHLATGGFPIDHSLDRATMMRQIATAPPQPFSTRGVPPWPDLEAVLHRALATRSRDRFASMDDLVRALTQVCVPPLHRHGATGMPTPTTLDRVVDRFLARMDVRQPAFTTPARAPRCSVMLGTAGTAFALYRIAMLRDDGPTLALADAWLSRVEHDAVKPLAFDAPDDGLDMAGLGPVSPFHADTGVHVVRAMLAVAMQQPDAARSSVLVFCDRITQPWPRRDLTLGRMGAVLGCTLLVEALPASMPESITTLRTTGDILLDQLWDELGRLGRIGNGTDIEDHGMAHGWAGLIWATLRWCRATSRALPDTLESRLAELADGAEPLGRGVHWAQRVTGSLPSVLATHQVAGWCNGPAGFVQLMALGQLHFPRAGYGRLMEASAWSTWEAPSTVFDLCCGLTGRAYALLCCYQASGAPEWRDRAGILAGRAFQFFESTNEPVHRPTSLFKGEAGLALLAADLRRPEQATFPFAESPAADERVIHG